MYLFHIDSLSLIPHFTFPYFMYLSPTQSEPLSIFPYFSCTSIPLIPHLIPLLYLPVLPSSLSLIHPFYSPVCTLICLCNLSALMSHWPANDYGWSIGSILARFVLVGLFKNALINHKCLLISFQILHSALRDYRLVFPGCVSHVVSPAQSSVHKVTVLGFGEEQDKEKVFVALPVKGILLIAVSYFF